MLLFALKNLAVKKTQTLLIILSVVLSCGVAVLAYNTSSQVNDGISGTAAYYSAIVGPAGSKTQLAMNTMYFTDTPLGTIPYEVVSVLQQDSRVTEAIPFAMADSYNGYSVVGTDSQFLSTKAVAEGRLFDDTAVCEVVVGSTVAHTCGLSVGDSIFTSHSAGEVHAESMTVVGILEETHTVYDRQVFTELRTVWEVHEHEEAHDEEHEEEQDEEHEGHDHEDMNRMVCAVLVRTKNPAFAMTLVNDYDGRVFTDYDGDSFPLQAIEPMDTVRGVLQDADTTRYIVFILCAVILIMNIMVISIITLLNMHNAAKEIALMRLIGIGMGKISLVYMIQNALIGLVSCALSFGVSRLCLALMGDYVAGMGVVLNPAKIYSLEWVILAAVLLITVLPTVICTAVMARHDSLSE